MTAWTDVIGWTLVHFVWEGALIAATAAVALRVLRPAAAQLRYATACSALLVALAAPLVTAAVLVVPTLTDASVPPSGTVAPVHTQGGIGGVHAVRTALAGSALDARLAVDNRLVGTALTALVGIWTGGVLFLTARLAFGWWRVRRLQAEALAEPASEWLSAAARIATRLGLARAIHVVDSVQVDTPTVIGWLQPVVLLPVAALANLTPGQVQAILAHELAHVRRHDFVVNLLQTIAETLLFYHPAVWWLSSRIRTEREHCCDDVAVEVCGDPIAYAEALTTLASWAMAASPLALAATGGSLLQRVRRVLRLPADSEPRRPKAPFVIAATVLLVLVVGMRLIVVAQTVPPVDDSTFDRRLGPMEINRVLGYNLFPGPVHYATDDPVGARAWDVKVAYPEGEMALMGFTARGLIRYAYHLENMPVVDGPSWLDTQSLTIRAETSAVTPEDEDYREAVRVTLEGQYGISIRRDARLFPVLGLQPANPGALGPNIRPSTAACFDSQRDRLDTIGPTLYARGQQMQFCGIDNTIGGPRGYRVTLAEFARSLRGFTMAPVDRVAADREVVDQTGLTGVYDFELDLGFLPLAAVVSAHPTLAIGFGPMIRTFPQAIEEQLGLRLVPSEAPRDVAVIVSARQQLQVKAAELEPQLAAPHTAK